MVGSHFEDLTSYKNRNGGIWVRGEMHVCSNAKFADNAIGMTHSNGSFGIERLTSRLIDSLAALVPNPQVNLTCSHGVFTSVIRFTSLSTCS